MKENPQKKRKIIYVFGYCIFILFWLIVICLSLELFERFRWKYIEKTNKFVRIRRGELLFKEWNEGQEEGIQYGEGKNLSPPQQLYVGDEWCEPEPDPLETWSYRLNFYLDEDEIFQSAFRSIYDIKQFRLDISKKDHTFNCSSIHSDFDEPINFSQYLTLIKNIPLKLLQMGRAFFYEANISSQPQQFFFYPIHDNIDTYSFHVFLINQEGKSTPLNPLLAELPTDNLWSVKYFEYRPHINSTEMLFRTNNFGFRDRDFTVPKPDGVFRILCIGASTTEEGISNQETYPKFLEQELQKHLGKNKIEVFNCGISGMTLKKHFVKLPDYLYLQPDLVILYEGINDVVYEVFPNVFDNAPILLRPAFLLSHFARRQMRGILPYPQEKISQSTKQFIFYYIDRMYNTFSSRGIEMCISSVGVPYREELNKTARDYYDYYYDKEWGWANSTFQQYCDVMRQYNQQLKDYCKERDILYLPVAENIPASTKYFGDICHMRQEGVKLKAQIIADTLIPYLQKIIATPQPTTVTSE